MDEKLEKTYSYSFLADTKEGNFQVGRKLEENLVGNWKKIALDRSLEMPIIVLRVHEQGHTEPSKRNDARDWSDYKKTRSSLALTFSLESSILISPRCYIK